MMRALVVYLMCGRDTPDLARVAVESGADVIELGFPFSDPLADGPVIRRAAERALAEGMTIARCLDCLAVTRSLVDVPLIPMTYSSLFEAHGWELLDAGDAGGRGDVIDRRRPTGGRTARATACPAGRADVDRRADPAGGRDDRGLALPRDRDGHDRDARRALSEPRPARGTQPQRDEPAAVRGLRHLHARPRRRGGASSSTGSSSAPGPSRRRKKARRRSARSSPRCGRRSTAPPHRRRLRRVDHFQLEQVADDAWAAIATPDGGAVANAGIVRSSGATIVFDTTMLLEAALELRRAAERIAPVAAVVCSHWHADHVGGNPVFEDVDIVATERTRELLETDGLETTLPNEVFEEQFLVEGASSRRWAAGIPRATRFSGSRTRSSPATSSSSRTIPGSGTAIRSTGSRSSRRSRHVGRGRSFRVTAGRRRRRPRAAPPVPRSAAGRLGRAGRGLGVPGGHPTTRGLRAPMNDPVRVACIQAEPIVLNREATLDKLEHVAAEAAAGGAELLVFRRRSYPRTPPRCGPVPSRAGPAHGAREAFALLARESVEVPAPPPTGSPRRPSAHGVWIVTGVNEIDPERPATIYNSLLYHAPDGTLAQAPQARADQPRAPGLGAG